MTIVSVWKKWPNFSIKEMQCRGNLCNCSDLFHMDDLFMDKLQQARTAHGGPLLISSAYRCPLHNSQVSKTGLHGPHTTGCAADIQIFGENALRFLAIAAMVFPRIGIQQKGDFNSRFIHVDSLTIQDNYKDNISFVSPALWTY